MDQHLEHITQIKIKKTMENLEKNQMKAYYAKSITQAQMMVQSLLEDGDTVSVGGSMTLFETGIINMLRDLDVHFLDRYKEGNTPEIIGQIYRDTFSADALICSSNAITMEGDLYNIDGNGNRVAAMIFGPKKVIVLAGANKIVPTMKEAEIRLRQIAAPANATRLNLNTPCVHTGECSDCKSPERICSSFVKLSYQRNKDRIHVIILDERAGY